MVLAVVFAALLCAGSEGVQRHMLVLPAPPWPPLSCPPVFLKGFQRLPWARPPGTGCHRARGSQAGPTSPGPGPQPSPGLRQALSALPAWAETSACLPGGSLGKSMKDKLPRARLSPPPPPHISHSNAAGSPCRRRGYAERLWGVLSAGTAWEEGHWPEASGAWVSGHRVRASAANTVGGLPGPAGPRVGGGGGQRCLRGSQPGHGSRCAPGSGW